MELLIEEDTNIYSKSYDDLRNIDKNQWSCSFVTPKAIRKFAQSDKANPLDLLKISVPWMYPFYFASQHETGLTTSMAQSFLQAFDYLENTNSRSDKHMRWEHADPTRILSPDLPSIVKYLLSRKITADSAPFSNLMVVSSIPIQEVFQKRPHHLRAKNSGSLSFDELGIDETVTTFEYKDE